jgi:hypothetical protein
MAPCKKQLRPTTIRLHSEGKLDPAQTSLKSSNRKIYRQSPILPKMPFQANLSINKPVIRWMPGKYGSGLDSEFCGQ